MFKVISLTVIMLVNLLVIFVLLTVLYVIGTILGMNLLGLA